MCAVDCERRDPDSDDTQEPKMTFPQCTTHQLRELAYRASNGLEVTLFWHPGTDELKVCVCDHKAGAYFEIRPRPDQALAVFDHPYAYVAQRDAYYEDERLVA
jgi:hypothetical protein